MRTRPLSPPLRPAGPGGRRAWAAPGSPFPQWLRASLAWQGVPRRLWVAGALALATAFLGCESPPEPAALSADAVQQDAAVAGDASGQADVQGRTGSDASDAASVSPVIDVNAGTFDCLHGWTKVRGFRLKRLVGDEAEALAVANSATGGVYPAGTVIQLVPTEAMVKREKGFSPMTKDWEFFFLKVTSAGAVIVDRGTTEVKNGFGGKCFGCHNQASAEWDLVCEQGHGCAALPLSSELIQALQDGDPRCPK